MVHCDWCGKSTKKIAKIKMGKSEFKICEGCVEQFKNHKCIDCGCQVSLQTSDKGRCLKCAQVYNYKLEKEIQDAINEYPFEHENEMSDEEFNAWLTGSPLDKQKQG